MSASLSRLLHQAAQRHAGRPAVLHAGGTTTYAELAADVERLAGLLGDLGLAGRRVALLLPNLPTFPLALYGAWRAGCPVLMLNPLNSPREVEEFLLDAGVRDVLTAEPLRALLPDGCQALLVDALPGEVLVAGPEGERRFALADAPSPPPEPTGGDAEAAVLYTAASDGWSRGAVLSHHNLIANLNSTVEAMRIGPEDRMVAALPLIHAFGLTVSLNATLAAGARVVPVERFHPVRMLELLEQAKPTLFAGVPAMYIALLGAVERRGAPEHALRVTLCGGAPLPPEVAARWEEVFGLPLRQGYGLTEAGPVCLFNRVDRPNHPGTLGHPFPGVEVSIRGPDGRTLPPGEVGEICVRGDNVFLGYLGDGGRSPAVFHGDWLRTGDLGTEEPGGVIRFRGILKPMFTRNGFNVYPREMERVLEADPRIDDAQVLALPDPVRENEIVLVLRPAPGAELSEEGVAALCRARFAAYKQPSRVLIGA
jgi:long-chain acyl-CoA synthetase